MKSMYLFAFLLIVVSMGLSCLGAGTSLLALGGRTSARPRLAEFAGLGTALAFALASGILLYALVTSDFSVVYVADYTDRGLPLFYRMTAFWAGQAGSLLFWALAVSLCGVVFQFSQAYARLSAGTKHWYWVFYLAIMAFFAMLLATWNNPFLVSHGVPADGSGLNPLLQNPGMIFHPPLLFLGYGGFVIPGCLALAQSLNHAGAEPRWTELARPFVRSAWGFLSAGIVLGGWWAYMELGWGGYWAWDPVENASLIPWLVATAALHTLSIENRRGKLAATNVFLMALATISAFFATYLVRSGVVQSVHAFGDGGVGEPLLLFVGFSLALSLWIAVGTRNPSSASLNGLESREGFLVLTAWLLLALGGIILVATLWPVITSAWAVFSGGTRSGSVGLTAGFYNRVCLPLLAGLMALLAVCPWLGWNGGIRRKTGFFASLLVLAGGMAALWFWGYRLPTSVLAASSAGAILVGSILLLREKAFRTGNALCVCGLHAGAAIMALAIAFSGSYKIEADLFLKRGESATVGAYTVTLKEMYAGRDEGYQFIEGELVVQKGSEECGVLVPQRRVYDKWRQMQFAEASTLFSLGSEVYASLLGVDESNTFRFRVSVNPLVNWLWIGGAMLSIIPFFMMRSHRRKDGE